MKRLLIFILLFFFQTAVGWAQCAMCRVTLENNYSNGKTTLAANINTGILYLLVLPYLAVLSLGYFWYIASKNAR